MAISLVKWPSRVTFSRGDSKKNDIQYSPGGKDGEEVEVPQIDESLSLSDFAHSLVNLVGDESETKKIINRRVLAEPAIRDGQLYFKSTYKKSGVLPLEDATKQSIKKVGEYVPTLAKERGAVVAEAFKKANLVDSIKAARLKVSSGEMSQDDYFALLESQFAPDEE